MNQDHIYGRKNYKNEKDIFTLVLFPDFWPGYTGANPGYRMVNVTASLYLVYSINTWSHIVGFDFRSVTHPLPVYRLSYIFNIMVNGRKFS